MIALSALALIYALVRAKDGALAPRAMSARPVTAIKAFSFMVILVGNKVVRQAIGGCPVLMAEP